MKKLFLFLFVLINVVCIAYAEENFEVDTFETSKGELKITFIGHASLMVNFDGKVIYIDPWSRMADYSKFPKADLVLSSHEHIDHLDPAALDIVCTAETILLYPESCARKYKGGIVMKYGDKILVKGFIIETVPAYNTFKKRVHPHGLVNGYVVPFGDKRVYFAGETGDIPELEKLKDKDIDIAFLAMDSVYNMTPEMAAKAAKIIKPRILYPIHTADEEPSKLVDLLKDTDIDVRIRKMQ